MRHVDSFINSFLEWTSDVPSSEKFLRWTALATLAATLGRKTWVNYNGIQCYPNIFTMLIGPAGLTKKTTAARHSAKLLRQVGGVNVISDQITPAKLLHEMSEFARDTRFQIGDKDYPCGAAFMYAPEAVNLIGKSKYGNMLNILTELYDSDPNGWHENSPFKKSTISDGAVLIHNPSMNFLGCTTPETLSNQIISSKEIDSGFASRVFFVYEKTVAGKSPIWRDDEQEGEASGLEALLVSELQEIFKLSGPFKIAEDVKSLQNQFLKKNEAQAMEAETSRLKSFYGRKATHILKIAQVIAASESRKMEITAQNWIKAFHLIEEVEKDMHSLFGGIGNSPESLLLYKVWETVRLQDEFTLSILLERFWHEANRIKLVEALGTLISMKRLAASNKTGVMVYKVLDKRPLK